MTRSQIVQYVAAFAAILSTVLTDPEVRTFLVEHPWTTGGLLSAPSLVTMIGLVTRVVARRGAPDPQSEVPTDRIEVEP